MTCPRLLLLGRTGVGKSSLINFLAGDKYCNTDPYRACTKEPAIVRVKYRTSEFELIDTPGLGEGDIDLDSQYLALIDPYLVDPMVAPHFVFRSDDSRLRREDYQLLNALLNRYGERIFRNGGLMLTFAGNLESEYHARVLTRVRLITSAIREIQISLGIRIFVGFSRITLVDSELKLYEVIL